MKTVIIHSRSFEENKFPYVQEIIEETLKYTSKVVLSEDLYLFCLNKGLKWQSVSIFTNHKDLPDADFFLSVGGDGTLLEAATYIMDKSIPILGINTGRLGFLATNARDEYKFALKSIFEGYFTIEERGMICLDSSEDIFEGLPIALNEFAIMKRDTSSMIVVHTYINGEYLNSYWADGLIVATPTGSTGYSLSVGGPVIVPHASSFVISPVSPHNLNVRPLIIPDSSIISFEIEGRSKNFLVSLDSRSRKVDASIQLAVRCYEHKAKLIRLSGQSFLKTLRSKLNWGMDIRNYPEKSED
jgi:NAD+ kinase